MAAKSVDMLTTKLLNVKQIFARLDPDKLTEALEPGLLATLAKVVDDVAKRCVPSLWTSMPPDAQDEASVVLACLEQVPIFMRSFMRDVRDNIEDVLDITHLAVSLMVENKVRAAS
ncbi:unnamed protein product [Phaeothamnion confervicola]